MGFYPANVVVYGEIIDPGPDDYSNVNPHETVLYTAKDPHFRVALEGESATLVPYSGSNGGREMNRLTKAGLAVGGGALAFRALQRTLNPEPRYMSWEKPRYEDFQKKVLIIGGGFGGYTAAKTLCDLVRDREDVGVMVIARANYFTFWPMVPGVISSEVDARNVAQPLRGALVRDGASFRRAEVESIDYDRQVVAADGHEFPYDELVVALGAQPNFFGIPGTEEHSLTMRGPQDAERIRNRVIERFEEATFEEGEVSESKLTFVVIGAGATGVETASGLHELVHEMLAPDYPDVDPDRVRIVLLEGLPHILPELDPALRRTARARLASERIEVKTNTLAGEITDKSVKLKGGREILSENVIWTAGASPNSKIEELDLPLTKRDGVEVDRTFRVKDRPHVWSIGDCAAIPTGEDGYLPPNAQAATQEGYALARNVLAALDGGEPEEFEYKPAGQLVELGTDFAVNDVMGVKFSGLTAALFWKATYLVRLESPQNKARVVADWVVGSILQPSITQLRGSRE
jgi:NADH dehydrogenase